MGIVQLQAGVYTDAEAPILRLAPSVVRQVGRRSHVQVGAIAPLSGDNAYGAMMSLWFTF